MRRVEPAIAIALLLVLAACHRVDPAAEPSSAVPTSGLERAAIESGAVADSARMSPVGLFQRRTEAGHDSLCLLPAQAGRYPFGMESVFGAEEYCRGRGSVKRAGDKLIFDFSGHEGCVIVARYDGDRITLPGVVDVKCAALCEGRGSPEGVAFPRLGSDAQSALGVRDRDGEPLCE